MTAGCRSGDPIQVKSRPLRALVVRTFLCTIAALPATGVRADSLAQVIPSAGRSAAVGGKLPAGTNPAGGLGGTADTRQMIATATQYEHAEGVPRDFERAAALYCKAARLGDAEAQFALGWMYANGRGVPRDDGVAAQIFALAADRGHPAAKVMRGYTESPIHAPLPTCLLPDPPAQLSMIAPEIAGPPMSEAYFKGPIYKIVSKLSDKSGIDPKLVMAVILVESGFNPRAQSPKNAQGLMQLIPETAQRFRVRDAFDPEENIKGGIAYLKWLLAYFKGDVSLVAAAYNAGEGTVEKYRGVPPYPETQKYVRRIAQLYQKAMHPYESGLLRSGGTRGPAWHGANPAVPANPAYPATAPVGPTKSKSSAIRPRVVAQGQSPAGTDDAPGSLQPASFDFSRAAAR